MTNDSDAKIGTIAWHDLTVENAETVRDFYANVVGWKPEGVSMGDYDDFNMTAPATGEPAAGVCHARGTNANIPPQWLIYITVADLKQSMEQCTRLGGKVVHGPREAGGKAYCVIQDPAGAHAALIEA